jgi:hypothetical protein
MTKKYPVLHFLSFFLLFLSILCKFVCQTFCFSTQTTVEYNSAKCRQVIVSHTSLTHEDVSAIHRRLCRINDIRHSIYERDQSFVFKAKKVINSSFFTNSRSFFYGNPLNNFTNCCYFWLQTPVHFFYGNPLNNFTNCCYFWLQTPVHFFYGNPLNFYKLPSIFLTNSS